MSELRDFIKNNMLEHDETVMLKRYDTRRLNIAFTATDFCEYTCHSFKGSNTEEEIRKLFPPNATFNDGLVISPFTEESLYKIIELAKQDDEVNKYLEEQNGTSVELDKSMISKLNDFIEANKLDHNETFCIERWNVSKIKAVFDKFDINYTCWGWQLGLPEEMDILYAEPKRIYALFTGPFTKDAILQIHELALSSIEKEPWFRNEFERWTEALKVPGLVAAKTAQIMNIEQADWTCIQSQSSP